MQFWSFNATSRRVAQSTLTQSVKEFQANNKLEFRNVALLVTALTHPSYLNEHPNPNTSDNARLEFLGDAIIDFVAAEWLYDRFAGAPEGELTRWRAALVRTDRLAYFAAQCGIGDALKLGRGEEENHGRERLGNLCDAYEALIAAIYLDRGLARVKSFILPLFDQALVDILRLDLDRDPKSVLQDLAQARWGITPSYKLLSSTGPDHAKEFTVAVEAGERVYAEGSGASKQAATRAAATLALLRIGSTTNSE